MLGHCNGQGGAHSIGCVERETGIANSDANSDVYINFNLISVHLSHRLVV